MQKIKQKIKSKFLTMEININSIIIKFILTIKILFREYKEIFKIAYKRANYTTRREIVNLYKRRIEAEKSNNSTELLVSEILFWIQQFKDFDATFSDEIVSNIEYLFRGGYCWHFAKMLQAMYQDGKVYYVYNETHFVFGIHDHYFDIEGEYFVSENNELIPEYVIEDIIEHNFFHKTFKTNDDNKPIEEFFKQVEERVNRWKT